MNWLDAIREAAAAAALAVGEAIAPPPEPVPESEPPAAVVETAPGAVRVCSAPDDGEPVCRDVAEGSPWPARPGRPVLARTACIK